MVILVLLSLPKISLCSLSFQLQDHGVESGGSAKPPTALLCFLCSQRQVPNMAALSSGSPCAETPPSFPARYLSVAGTTVSSQELSSLLLFFPQPRVSLHPMTSHPCLPVWYLLAVLVLLPPLLCFLTRLSLRIGFGSCSPGLGNKGKVEA